MGEPVEEPLTLPDTVPETDPVTEPDTLPVEHTVGVIEGLALPLKLTDCVPEMHPETVGEEVAHCEALGLGDRLPDAQLLLDWLGDCVPDPQEVADCEGLLLGDRLPVTVPQMVGEVLTEAVLLREVQPEAVTDSVPVGLTDTLPLALSEGDWLPLTVCVTVPLEQGVGVGETLTLAE